MILITGATGNIGTELTKILSASRTPAHAFVHNRLPSGEIALPSIEIAEGDFSKTETFAPALAGVDCLFLLIPSSSKVEEQQRNFVDEAKRSKVKRIVKLSQLVADENAAGRFQRYHAAVEKHILKWESRTHFCGRTCSRRPYSTSVKRFRLRARFMRLPETQLRVWLMCAILRPSPPGF